MMEKKIASFVIIFVFCLFVYSFAETIALKSGRTVEGKITERTDEYVAVDIYGASLTYFLDDIESINGERVQQANTNIEYSEMTGIKYRDIIGELYKVVPDNWSVAISKTSAPYGYVESPVNGIHISFRGPIELEAPEWRVPAPAEKVWGEDRESFYLVIMPIDYSTQLASIKTEFSADRLLGEIDKVRVASPPHQFRRDWPLGKTDKFLIFYRRIGPLEYKRRLTWPTWKEDVIQAFGKEFESLEDWETFLEYRRQLESK